MSHGKKVTKSEELSVTECPVKRITVVMGYKQLISGCCQLTCGCCQRINGCCQRISGYCQRISSYCQRIGGGRKQMLLLLTLICWLTVLYFLYTVLSVHSVRPNQKASQSICILILTIKPSFKVIERLLQQYVSLMRKLFSLVILCKLR
jgi:hypothetical protein